MKRINRRLILIFSLNFIFLVCLAQSDSALLTFGSQKTSANNLPAYYHSNSQLGNTSNLTAYATRPPYHINQVQQTRAKFGRTNARVIQPNYYQWHLLTLANQQILNQVGPDFTNSEPLTAENNSSPELSSSESNCSANPELSNRYPADYNPFIYDYLSEKFYDLRAYFSSKYRTEQEQKYPYLIPRRHKLEHAKHLVREIKAAKNLRLSPAAIKLIHNYNQQLNLLNLPAPMDNQGSSELEFESLADSLLYDLQISPDFFQAKFNNSEQQLLHARQLEIINTIADHKIFVPNMIGLQDFSNTVLETVAIAHQANRADKIAIATVFTDLASDFTALGRGLINGGCNFVGHIVQAGDSLISHPLDTAQAVVVNLGILTKNVAVGLLKTLIVIEKSIVHPKTIMPNLRALHADGCEICEQFYNYIETVPRAEKLEQLGTIISEQLLSLAVNLATGKTITFVSESVAAAYLHKAIAAKNKHDKAKSSKEKVAWLSKFGLAGRDAAQTLGLIATEEYELATIDGLLVSVKTHPTADQTLFRQSEEYLKHNKSGKKSKTLIDAKSTDSAQQKVRIINTMPKQEFFRKIEIKDNYQPIGREGI